MHGLVGRHISKYSIMHLLRSLWWHQPWAQGRLPREGDPEQSPRGKVLGVGRGRTRVGAAYRQEHHVHRETVRGRP